jgi:hypothetical protein
VTTQERAGIDAWSATWDARKVLKKLLQGCREDALAEFEVGGTGDRAASSFWKRVAVHSAFGQVVGVALLSLPAAAGGPLTWTSDERRFWPMSCDDTWRARLALMNVLDVACMGSFMSDGIAPDSNDIELAPIYGEASRMPLNQLSVGCIAGLHALPCYHVINGQAIARGTVQNVLSGWMQSHRILPGTAAVAMRSFYVGYIPCRTITVEGGRLPRSTFWTGPLKHCRSEFEPWAPGPRHRCVGFVSAFMSVVLEL